MALMGNEGVCWLRMLLMWLASWFCCLDSCCTVGGVKISELLEEDEDTESELAEPPGCARFLSLDSKAALVGVCGDWASLVVLLLVVVWLKRQRD